MKNGRPTSQISIVKGMLAAVTNLYGTTPVSKFGALNLRAIQQSLVGRGLAVKTVNHLVNETRRLFKWATSHELCPAAVWQSLTTVPGERKGRTKAREPQPIPPVSDDVVDATLPHLSAVVADMVRFQRLTGCRPGEARILRPVDIDRSGDVWLYRPRSHKTEHKDRTRVIFIGPKAKEILLPYLLRDADAYCFSPSESEKLRRECLHAARKTPPTYGNVPGSNRKLHPKRRAGNHFTKDSYNRAIQRACESSFEMPKNLRNISSKVSPREQARLAKLPEKERQEAIENARLERIRLKTQAAEWRAQHCWTPNQLRHAAGTEVRRQFGLEAAQVVLGHAGADVTQVYAERDQLLAAEVMRKIG